MFFLISFCLGCFLLLLLMMKKEDTIPKTSQACAVCKYQRRKCTKECALAPYFPADQQRTFRNARRLFGVHNILKILKQVKDDEKDETMRSIIYESNMRARFPVHGCLGIILHLQYQAEQVKQQILHAKRQIEICKKHQCDGFVNSDGIGTRTGIGTAKGKKSDDIVEPRRVNSNIIFNNTSMEMETNPNFFDSIQQEMEFSLHYNQSHTIDIKEACPSSAESRMKNIS
ncbi:protein ASYMMETRIC LEAVES 2-like [Jatropha curcas]|uniref:protein ASYMMETRIC LEAVES 2-like n=1 Tax=Jatropha curcas TaxID=180498 RepID=UPI0018939F94|nr:protein ASYMMETRIC LEAVES 2-like [Jatropha curcas]